MVRIATSKDGIKEVNLPCVLGNVTYHKKRKKEKKKKEELEKFILCSLYFPSFKNVNLIATLRKAIKDIVHGYDTPRTPQDNILKK